MSYNFAGELRALSDEYNDNEWKKKKNEEQRLLEEDLVIIDEIKKDARKRTERGYYSISYNYDSIHKVVIHRRDYIFEQMGFEVIWNRKLQKVTLSWDD